VYFRFRPPYCGFDALNATTMSRKEAVNIFIRKKPSCVEHPDEDNNVDHIIWNPTEKDIFDAEMLSEMNYLILSNV
jgi:hypothetical protein